MFASTLFNWTPHSESAEKPIPVAPAAAIVKMLEGNVPEIDIIASINKLTLDELNEPVQAIRPGSRERFDNHPKVTLLRSVHAWLGTVVNRTQSYPTLEQYLLQRGVEQDFVYQWAVASEIQEKLDPKLRGENKLSADRCSPIYTCYSNFELIFEYLQLLRSKQHYEFDNYLSHLSYDELSRTHMDGSDYPYPTEIKVIIDKIKSLIDTLDQNKINEPVKAYNITLLHFAASFGLKEITEYLLQKNADVNAACGQCNMTPLLCALHTENDIEFPNKITIVNQTAEILLNHNANIYAKTSGGQTILDICAEHRNEVMLVKLLKLGIDPYATSRAESQQYVNEICDKHGIDQGMRFCNLL